MQNGKSLALGVRTAFVLFLALTAGDFMSPAVAAPPPKSAPTGPLVIETKLPKSRFAILAPAEGANLPAGKTMIIGRTSEEGGRVDLFVDGSMAGQATLERDGFYCLVTLSPGKNTIVARSGKNEFTITVNAGGKPDYVSHPSLEKCGGCHPAADASFKMAGPKDKMCYRCHQRKDRRKNVHGPMGAGECTACHDPHGSSHKSLTVAEPLSLCVMCHDQESSEKHMTRSKGKPCTQCHDPHASDKPYHQK
ncbi:MAG TPA: cytochrome c3 family protein [Candidatus Deferrimicrobiaceae bacterium]|jgi:predicted CXXCH cytochrome family protein